MGFFKKLFNRSPEDYLAKGDGYLAAHSYYEARSAFEAGLQACQGHPGQSGLSRVLETRICETNRAMAELNLHEAEHALRQGMVDKAVEHLELAKTLTDDGPIREKADQLLAGFEEKFNNTEPSGIGTLRPPYPPAARADVPALLFFGRGFCIHVHRRQPGQSPGGTGFAGTMVQRL
jgi:tetratricopeptide (TPR) repeat protein